MSFTFFFCEKLEALHSPPQLLTHHQLDKRRGEQITSSQETVGENNDRKAVFKKEKRQKKGGGEIKCINNPFQHCGG